MCNNETLEALRAYYDNFADAINGGEFFFVNRLRKRISEQSARLMVKKYGRLAKINKHITPHMFRHTIATLLLEKGVDIRYIQNILGHSSIVTTQIYTHVNATHQRKILTAKHPRRLFMARKEN